MRGRDEREAEGPLRPQPCQQRASARIEQRERAGDDDGAGDGQPARTAAGDEAGDDEEHDEHAGGDACAAGAQAEPADRGRGHQHQHREDHAGAAPGHAQQARPQGRSPELAQQVPPLDPAAHRPGDVGGAEHDRDGRQQAADAGSRVGQRHDPHQQQVERGEQHRIGHEVEADALVRAEGDGEAQGEERDREGRPDGGRGPPRRTTPGNHEPDREADACDDQVQRAHRAHVQAQPATADDEGVEEQDGEPQPADEGGAGSLWRGCGHAAAHPRERRAGLAMVPTV